MCMCMRMFTCIRIEAQRECRKKIARVVGEGQNKDPKDGLAPRFV
jgi:hypothetical protein